MFVLAFLSEQDLRELEALAPALSDLEGEDDGMEMPPISEILKDIPVPDPRVEIAAPRMELSASTAPADVHCVQHRREDRSRLDRQDESARAAAACAASDAAI